MATRLLQDLLSVLTRRDVGGNGDGTVRVGREVVRKELNGACERLLGSDGEASSIGLARKVLDIYSSLTEDQRHGFFTLLREGYGPDRQAVEKTYAEYARTGSEESLGQLSQACEPRRQELMRRLNLVPGGTCELVRMRTQLLQALSADPLLKPVDQDFVHLLGSWFNRGFLVLRKIDWETSASILEKIIKYESVHAITDWTDLRRRLDSRDRRCYAFFHPALGDEPLVFVEVALTREIPNRVQDIINAEEHPAVGGEEPRTAAFFGISNCQFGLRGISFGNFLIKQVVKELKLELPSLSTFVTLSPVPGLTAWLDELLQGNPRGLVIPRPWRTQLEALREHGWASIEQTAEGLGEVLTPLTAWYLCEAKNAEGMPRDPVARFHLGNGARMERINWLGDISEKGLRQGAGMMVNYVYDIDQIERNHEQFASQGVVAASRSVRKALKVFGEPGQEQQK